MCADGWEEKGAQGGGGWVGGLTGEVGEAAVEEDGGEHAVVLPRRHERVDLRPREGGGGRRGGVGGVGREEGRENERVAFKYKKARARAHTHTRVPSQPRGIPAVPSVGPRSRP